MIRSLLLSFPFEPILLQMDYPINWIAIAIAAVSTLVLGFIWYNPKFFGKAWMKSVGMTEEDAGKGNMPVIFGLALVLGGVIAFNLSMYAGFHGPDEQTFMHGMVHGSLGYVFFGMPVLVVNSLFEQRSFSGIMINVFYWLVCFLVVGGIVFQMPPEAVQDAVEGSEQTGMIIKSMIQQLC
jgi:hypothetical protein